MPHDEMQLSHIQGEILNYNPNHHYVTNN